MEEIQRGFMVVRREHPDGRVVIGWLGLGESIYTMLAERVGDGVVTEILEVSHGGQEEGVRSKAVRRWRNHLGES
jgi:hypothetical protein